ncbi:MAG: ATP-binding protein [Patescibacteria group bacterium]|nr:ATP-binding protein [Patescibacteria group bacterium]
MQKKIKNRTIFSEIWKYIDDDCIILLNGPRQVGKTTLLKMIEEKLILEKNISKNQILWFDLEKSNHLNIWSKQTIAIDNLPKDSTKKYYLFIDEFQQAENIGSTLKVIHDHYPHIKTIITGSASWYLNINESMAGRKIVIPVFPLSFVEFLEWQSVENNNKLEFFKLFSKNITTAPTDAIQTINEQFQKFINWGGYPKIVLEQDNDQKIKLLNELIDSYLTRDIKIWSYRANILEVKKLLSLLAGQIGNTLSIDQLSNNSGLGRELLSNRLDLLQNTFILKLTPPYFTNKIKEITKSPKIYLIDSGLRNSLLNTFLIQTKTTEFGHVVENIAMTELEKNKRITDQLHFWRTVRQQEVDIILKNGNKTTPIEIKGGNQKTIPSGLRSFIRAYQPKEAYVLNWSIIKDEEYKNCQVHFRPVWFIANI